MKKTTKSKNRSLSQEPLRELTPEASQFAEGGQDVPPPPPARAHIITGG